MKFFKIFVLCIALCLSVGLVSASSSTYLVQGEHAGITITLIDGGIGYASDEEHTIRFSWSGGKNNQYEAHYWWINVPFTIEGNKLTSSRFPDDVAIFSI